MPVGFSVWLDGEVNGRDNEKGFRDDVSLFLTVRPLGYGTSTVMTLPHPKSLLRGYIEQTTVQNVDEVDESFLICSCSGVDLLPQQVEKLGPTYS